MGGTMRGLFFAAVTLLAASGWGQEFTLGKRVAEFTIEDTKGSSVSFSSLRGDLTVVMFIATKCPVSNAYNDRMKALYADYSPKGVKFVFVNANDTEPAAEVADHAREHGFPFPVYKDPANRVADRFGAQVTPEAFVIDKGSVIRYHGAIDDAQNVVRIKKQGLRNSLDELLAGQTVATAETKAFGCTIKRRQKPS